MSSADSITEHISRFVRNWLNWLPGVVLAVALDQISEALKLPIFSSDKGTEASAMVVIVSLASLSRHFRDWPLRHLISIVVIVVALVAFGWLKQTAWQEVSQRHNSEELRLVLYGFILGPVAWLMARRTVPDSSRRQEETHIDQEAPPEEKIHWIAQPDGALINIVFVHGVNGHYERTWNRGAGEKNLWSSWVADDFAKAAVGSLSYAANTSRWGGATMKLNDRAKSVLDIFQNEELLCKPTLFVTHSFGGIGD